MMTILFVLKQIALFFWIRVNPEKPVQYAAKHVALLRDLRKFKSSPISCSMQIGKINPCFGEESRDGVNSREYFYQDHIIAKRIYEENPCRHADIGSRLDGFVSSVAVFREIEIFDVREPKVKLPNVIFRKADFTLTVPREYNGAFDSVSCLHALEHFGLGRYGDRITPIGDILGIISISELLTHGGKLYLSVPIGRERLEFNAHRIYSVCSLVRLVRHMEINRFWYVDDTGSRGELHENVNILDGIVNNFGLEQGCGILEMTKP